MMPKYVTFQQPLEQVCLLVLPADQMVAGKSRSSASSKGKIRLSKEDVRLAKKMNVPLDVYAREKAKVEKAGDDYTTVNI